MKLTRLIQRDKEIQEDFINRSYWVGFNYRTKKDLVFVWKRKDKEDEPQIWTADDAIRYIQTLFDESEPKQPQPVYEEPEPKDESIHIVEETIDGEVISERWISSLSGDVVHEFVF